jgi:hypothetical protein
MHARSASCCPVSHCTSDSLGLARDSALLHNPPQIAVDSAVTVRLNFMLSWPVRRVSYCPAPDIAFCISSGDTSLM